MSEAKFVVAVDGFKPGDVVRLSECDAKVLALVKSGYAKVVSDAVAETLLGVVYYGSVTSPEGGNDDVAGQELAAGCGDVVGGDSVGQVPARRTRKKKTVTGGEDQGQQVVGES